jgi:hypothetical protein
MSDADLRRFKEDTSPSGHDVRRLKDRLLVAQEGQEDFDRLLKQLPSPAPGAEARVRARIHQDLRGRTRRPAWVLPTGAALASAAATLALLLLFSGPAQLEGELVADAALPAGLALEIEGQGAIEGTAREPRIQWRRGTLKVDVDPTAGLSVVVETPEAEVAVLGTAFSVVRGALGTTVAVERGRVGVRCTGESEGRVLEAGGADTCAPTTSAGLLARARALQSAGDPAGAVQSTEAGLATSPSAAVHTELSLVRVEALAAADRRSDALAAARALIDSGAGHRRTDALHVAVSLQGSKSTCAAVRPWLEELSERGARADELGRLADCVAKADPDRARRLLESALAADPSSVERAAIERRLKALESRGR